MKIDLDLALQRWATVAIIWEELSPGHRPCLDAFLAGWMMRKIGCFDEPSGIVMKDSYNAGFRQCDESIHIAERLENL